jgi:hypothetical protein
MQDDPVEPGAGIRRCRDVDPRRIGPVVVLKNPALSGLLSAGAPLSHA